MNVNKNINLGHLQQTFDFDQSPAKDSKAVLTFIDARIADNDHVMLDQVVNHFSIQPDRWSERHIRDLVFGLFKDDKIYFIIAGKKILPESIKTNFSEPAQSKLQFLQTRELFSIVRTHLFEPAQWQYIEIIKPEVVKEPVLLKAHHLGKKLFKDVGLVSQNSLCKNLRRHLRVWKSGLEGFREVAETGNYPGTNKIQEGLDLSNKILNIHDPCEFIETFLHNEDRLGHASSHFATLENFYKNQIHIWDVLIKAVEDFNPNRTVLEESPDVKKALETLCKILSDPKPYSMLNEIRGFISIVKPANDLIVAKQIAAAKTLAIEEIEKKIVQIRKRLKAKNANNDMSNKALFPLQTSKEKINTASCIQSIDDYLDDTIDKFNDAMDILG